jgi:hypothetical protein
METIDRGHGWRQIAGYPYMVNAHGEVYSLLSDRLMEGTNHKGYKRVIFCKGEKRKQMAVHRLVALAFLPNPDNKPYVNHKDMNPSNNRVSNLEWVTEGENTRHWHRNMNKRLQEFTNAPS